MTLPTALARRWGHLRFIKRQGAHEYSAECPKCHDYDHVSRHGHPDRFRMFDDLKPRGWCRRCGLFAFADDDRRNFKPDPAVVEQFRVEQLEAERRRRDEAERAIGLLQKDALWLRWHQEMPTDAQIWWTEKGVPSEWQKRLKLGFCPDKAMWFDGVEHSTATYTIPVFDTGWKLVNLRHRLATPMNGCKYRPDRAGLPQALYLTDPENPIGDYVVAVEGEVKAIVVRVALEDTERVSVVGLPGKTPSDELLSRLDHAGRIVLILDPDADPATIAARWRPRSRVVRLPTKVDDALLQYGLRRDALRRAIRKAKPE